MVDHLYSLRVGGKRPKTRVRQFHLLYADAVRLARSSKLEEALRTLETDLELFVATEARDRLFVHAGVVGWRGRAVLCPGASLTGKTSLVAAMVRAGARYYSDEYAILDARGRVHPFPRPLGMRESQGAEARRVEVEELGGRSGRRPLPVGLIVQSHYRPGARWRPRRLSPGKGIMGLLANTVAVRQQPRFALATLTRAAGRVPVVESARGEASEVAGELLRELEQRVA